MEIKKIGILHHPRLPESLITANVLAERLSQLGASPWLASVRDEDVIAQQLPGLDLLMTLGGDGTILRAARLAAPHGKPLLGINMGQLGFLAELAPEEVLTKVPAILEGRFWMEDRLMLQVTSIHNEHNEGRYKLNTPLLALNDATVGRGLLSRTVRVETHIDGDYLTTYIADGVIVATPTGSTAYALAAGGPILQPELRNLLLTPIAPHLTVVHSLVLLPTAIVELKITTDHPSSLTIDGQNDIPLESGDVVTVTASPHISRFLRFQPKAYFYRTLLERLSSRIARGML
ncbi:MAG: NAD(+)/NADH kinase [Chloroflexota bacterium]|nr:NAD(+)/NADH kinase [Chloroflexota bacterium]